MDLLKLIRGGALRHTVSVSIVTSGYTDRYLTRSSHLTLTLPGGGHLQWADRDDAMRSIAELAEVDWDAVVDAARGTERRYVAMWQDGAASKFGPVRPEVLEAIVKCHGPNMRDEARSAARAVAVTATDDERACARWHLSECNRSNQRLVDLGLRPHHETQVDPGISDVR